MSNNLTNPDVPITKQDLANFYQAILPYLGGSPEHISDLLDVNISFPASGQILKYISAAQGWVNTSDNTEMIAPIEPDATSSAHTYSAGAHLVTNNVYYEVISVISIGDALVATGNTPNIRVACVGDEISSINTALSDKANKTLLTADSATSKSVSTTDAWTNTEIPFDNNGLYVIEYVTASMKYQTMIMGATLVGASASSPISVLGKTNQVDNILLAGNTQVVGIFASSGIGSGTVFVQKVLEVI